jgi:hypothetical protein
MSAGKALQLLGFLGVTFVLVASLASERSMLFEFGGLAAGAAIFLIGRALESRAK